MMLVDLLADRDGFLTGAEEYADTSKPGKRPRSDDVTT
jgi:hypothetical protein